MHGESSTPLVHLAAGLACLLSLSAASAGCGGGEAEGVASSLAGGHELDSGLRVSVDPGAIRRRSSRPKVWLASPGATLTLDAGAEDPPSTSIQLANLPPDATIQVDSVRELSSSQHARCPDRSTDTIDCSAESPPVCQAPELERGSNAPTVGELAIDPPSCREIVYGIDRPSPDSEALRLALAGPDVGQGDVARAAEIASDASARLLVLTGDHAERSSETGVDRLAEATQGLAVPVVLLPGEREVVGGNLSRIQRHFGPTQLSWTADGPSGEFGTDIQMVTFESPRQSLEVDGPERLVDRLDRLDGQRPMMVLTHTPPLDPRSLRDRGFRSRIEGKRVLSALTDGAPDVLAAGHLPTAERTDYGSLTAVVAGGATLTLVDLKQTSGGGLEVDVQRRSL